MNSREYNNINKIIQKSIGLREKDRNPARIIMLKERGILNSIFNKSIKNDFKTILEGFIEILEEPTLDNKPNYKKLLSYSENDFIKLFKTYGYELASWLNKEKVLTKENNRAFFNFPLFFKESCRKCSITKYATMDLEEIEKRLNTCVDLIHKESIEPRKDRNVLEKEIDVVLHTKAPAKNIYNTAAEEYSYKLLVSDNKDGKVERVSRDYGTGYGYDLLSVYEKRELLVVAKGAYNIESFILSKTEYETMKKYSNFQIHKYMLNTNENRRTIYRYDGVSNILVDLEDPTNICTIEEKISYKKNNVKKYSYICTPAVIKYEKETGKKIMVLKNNN